MLANVGIPMIFVQWPLMLVALIPVILIETLLIRLWLPLSTDEAFTGIAQANALSTAIGVPLAWGIMLVVEFIMGLLLASSVDYLDWKSDSPLFQLVFFIFSAAWPLPTTETAARRLLPIAAALLLIPCFYASVWVEYRSCLRSWARYDPVLVRRAVYRANLGSYALLFVLACVWIWASMSP
jgi:hypothetical protein